MAPALRALHALSPSRPPIKIIPWVAGRGRCRFARYRKNRTNPSGRVHVSRLDTGAKGLNSAVADVSALSSALIHYFKKDDDALLKRYSDVALERNWQVQRFSWANTAMYHQYPDRTAFDQRMVDAQLRYLVSDRTPQILYAENHTGPPIDYWPDI